MSAAAAQIAIFFIVFILLLPPCDNKRMPADVVPRQFCGNCGGNGAGEYLAQDSGKASHRPAYADR
jgi:hypothetical protein